LGKARIKDQLAHHRFLSLIDPQQMPLESGFPTPKRIFLLYSAPPDFVSGKFWSGRRKKAVVP
jgi:hypothetical protein